MATDTHRRATLDDLLRVDGPAELIGGRIVRMSPTGFTPCQLAGWIYRQLADFVDAQGTGHAFGDGMGFAVAELPSGRESFSPDASYYAGDPPARRMRFVEAAPTFAVEVRSDTDYGPAAERALAAKRADYFAAGTLVVWDVDPEAEVVRVYRSNDPLRPEVFDRTRIADAEPALPGWRLDVDGLFRRA